MSRHRLFISLIAAAAGLLVPVLSADADGLIVPVRPEIRVRGHWAVDYHRVDIRVRDQVASVAIDQKFSNTGRGMIEVEYLFPVPPGAAIDSMTMIVDGKEYAAKLLDADEARKIYEEIVRKKKDPALLEYAGFGLYRTRAFPLDPGKPVRVQVTYTSVCTQDNKTVEVWYPLNTEKFSAKKIADVRVTTDIKTTADITTVYSPSHEIDCTRKSPNHVIVEYREKDALPTTDFQLFYRAAGADVGTSLLTSLPDGADDGYYLMLVSPNPNLGKKVPVIPKDLLVVIDRSGSMSGTKIRQAKSAVRFVLGHLNEDDRFNVIPYSDTVDPVFKNPVPATREKVDIALEEVDATDAGGGTAIDAAIREAMCQWNADRKDDRPKYIIFLTDGKPTIGTTDTAEILRNAKKTNTCGARLFAFGVGYDVNIKLLDKLVIDHEGRSDYVKPKESVESKISSLYRKIKNPVVTNLAIEITGVKTRDTYPRNIGDLFDGDQLVVAGRYRAKDAKKLPRGDDGGRVTQLVITGTYLGTKRVFEYNVQFDAGAGRPSRSFVEKIWAVRRVGYLMDQIQLNGESDELVDELISLSKRYGIMTPYTSFLADETTVLHEEDIVRRRAKAGIAPLAKAGDGAEAQMGAMTRQSLNRADKMVADAAPAPAGEAAGKGGGARLFGHSSRTAYEAEKKESVAAVRNIGNQAIYRRGRVWVAANASDVDLSETAKIETVERYGEKYFDLVKANTAEENRILSSQAPHEELVLRLRGQVYRIK